ncbi:hypothetical protein [Paenibacillus alba]|uniref:Uncharacterized protein n=1 Tax=Paenibacillus alba TaxID=1197127 RepID=A0ABU6G704_9BACL|nr:hypothetical protein [Paenibacillus alba]MEC0229970.1 hypothetical protein [Paenibacillus alba]NQX66178.1 hypothetical protein [Paenibacillus alba]
MTMLWLILAVIVIVGAILVIYQMIAKKRNKKETNKVINVSFGGKKTLKGGKQVCSFCRKKANKLSFYSDEQGKVVGVCQVCKPHAERRALMRI